MKVKRIDVSWLDSCSSDVWQDVGANEKKPVVISTRGYLVEETKEYISISHSITIKSDQINMHAGFITIPKIAIIKRR